MCGGLARWAAPGPATRPAELGLYAPCFWTRQGSALFCGSLSISHKSASVGGGLSRELGSRSLVVWGVPKQASDTAGPLPCGRRLCRCFLPRPGPGCCGAGGHGVCNPGHRLLPALGRVTFLDFPGGPTTDRAALSRAGMQGLALRVPPGMQGGLLMALGCVQLPIS